MSIYRNLVLALLSFLLVTTVLPAAAEYFIVSNPTSTPSRQSAIPHLQSPLALLEQGKQRYDAGRFAEAARLGEQAAEAFEQRKELRNQALSYNYLAIVYQDLLVNYRGIDFKVKSICNHEYRLIESTSLTWLLHLFLGSQWQYRVFVE